MSASRQLAAIMFTDIVGYTTMMQEDEDKALVVVRRYTSALKNATAKYKGTVVNDYGDGNLCTFSSATEAVRCAIELQRNLQLEPKIPLRVGLHIGEVFFNDGKALGDGVNLASRIQSLGVANSILISAEILSKISNQTEFKTVSLGIFHFKNVTIPMEVFALANAGLNVPKRENMEGKVLARSAGPKGWRIAAVLIFLVVTSAFLYLQFWNHPLEDGEKKSIAVLAFEDLSPEKDQGWFSDGISEEIINSLTNLGELKVIARSSSFYFKDKSMTIAQIAEELGVDYVVEGSVRKNSDQLRVTIQLIDVDDESHIFSETYDRLGVKPLEVQRDIAENISRKLLGQLTPLQLLKMSADKPTSTEAFEFYLRGKEKHKMYQMDHSAGHDKHFFESERLFLKAISTESTYASAYGALADLYDSRGNVTDRLRLWRLRDSVALKGFEINPRSVDVLLARSFTFTKRNAEQPQPDSAYFYLKSAFELDPGNSEVLRIIGLFYLRVGLTQEGILFGKQAVDLDPLNPNTRLMLSNANMLLGDMTQSVTESIKALELDSLYLPVHLTLGTTYALQGDLIKARQELSFCQRLYPGDVNDDLEALILASEGKAQEALRLSTDIVVLSKLAAKAATYMQLDSLAAAPIITSSRCSLFSLQGLDKSPVWGFIRDEPEFKKIRENVKRDYTEKVRKYSMH